MQLKTLLYLISIIKIMHIEQTYLHALSHGLRKLEMIWYDISSNIQFLGLYIFKVPIVYYYLVILISNWWKIIHFSSKSLNWWYKHTHTVSCKIIRQVSGKTLVCVYISITNCKIKIFYFRGAIWTFSALYSFFLMFGFCPTGFFWLKIFNEIVEAHPN